LRFTDALVLQACNFRIEPFALLKLQHDLGCLPLPVFEGTRYHHTKHTKDDCDDALWSLYKLGGQNGTIGTTSKKHATFDRTSTGENLMPWQFGQLGNANWTTTFLANWDQFAAQNFERQITKSRFFLHGGIPSS